MNRGNTWRKNTDSEDDVEWAGGRPVAKRDPRDWEGAEQFGGRGRMAGSTPSSEQGAKQPERCQIIGKVSSPHNVPRKVDEPLFSVSSRAG